MYNAMYNIYKSQLNVENVGAVVAAPDKVSLFVECCKNAKCRFIPFHFTKQLVAKKLLFLHLVPINVRSI